MTFRPALLILCLALWGFDSSAQTAKQFLINPESTKVAGPATAAPHANSSPESKSTTTATAKPEDDAENLDPPKPIQTQFRVERMPLVGGAELLTIFARLDGLRSSKTSASP